MARVWLSHLLRIWERTAQAMERRVTRNPRGEWTVMIEWSWRVEGKRRVWCGTFSDGERWRRAFSRLEGTTVASVELYARLPEIDLGFSSGLHLLSMMTAEGDPAWKLSKQVEGASTCVRVRSGRLVIEE